MTVSAVGIILDPSEVATSRTELNINSGAIRIASEGPNWGDAAIAAAISDRKFGSVPVGYRIPNRIVTIPLIVRAVTGTTFNQAQTKLQQKVARFQDEGGWLKRTSSNGTTKLYADIVDATLTFPDPRFQDVEGGVVLTLECLPDFYGDEAAGIGSTASSGDHDSIIFTEADIPGDHPARSRYEFSDTGSQARQAVLIASQSKTYDSAATAALSYEAEVLTPLDTAAVVTQAGAHGGATNNAVEHTGIGNSWTPILSTLIAGVGNLTHRGNYRIFARVYSDNEALVRLEYAVGDATMRRANDAVTIPSGNAFCMVDLGEVRLPMDADAWIGAVYAYSETAATTTGVDKLYLAPTESLAVVKARREVTANVGVGLAGYEGRDTFRQAAGALNGKTADLGGNWTTVAGDADDFAINSTTAQAERTAVSDASLATGRFAVLGSAVTNSGVYVAFSWTSYTPIGMSGVLARYVDASNWMSAGLYRDGTGAGYSYVAQCIAGVISYPYGGPLENLSLQAESVQLVVSAAGTWHFHRGGVLVASGFHTNLATGGTLASGKRGIYDVQTGGGANTRKYDTFRMWAPDADAACLSGGILSVRHDRAERETGAATGIYAPAHVEGPYPRAPASGLEARTCRTLILPSAGDFDTLPDSDPLAFAVRSYHRPAVLFVNEE